MDLPKGSLRTNYTSILHYCKITMYVIIKELIKLSSYRIIIYLNHKCMIIMDKTYIHVVSIE